MKREENVNVPVGKLTRDRIEHAAREVAPLLMNYLRRRYRALSADHEDLIQQTLLDLLEFLQAHEERVLVQSEIPALAFTILKRRIADRFRDATRLVAQAHDVIGAEATDSAAPLDAGLRYRKLLWAVLQVLTNFDARDRGLLLREEMPGHEPAGPMSSADRKRLSRLREQLRSALVSRFGTRDDLFGG